MFESISKLLLTGAGILTLATSCSWNPFINQKANQVGILKYDSSVKVDGFGRVNKTTAYDGSSDPQGLLNANIAKLIQTGKDDIWALSYNRGLFHTTDGGRSWTRTYIADPRGKNGNDLKNILNFNNSLDYRDFVITQNGNIFISGADNTGVGKIYKSTNKGETFIEVYTDANAGTAVRRIGTSKNNSNIVYGALDARVIASNDGGATWKKVADTTTTIQQIDYLISGQIFVLTNDGNVYVQTGDEANPTFSQNQLKSASGNISGTTRLIQSVTNGNEFLLVGQNSIFYTNGGLINNFNTLSLPVSDSTIRVITAQADPTKGMDKIMLSINNNLYTSVNRGQTWQTRSDLGITTGVGNIKYILMDKNNSEVIYLGLSNTL